MRYIILFLIIIFGQDAFCRSFVNTGEMTVSNESLLFIGGNHIEKGEATVLLKGTIEGQGDFQNDITSGNVFSETSDGTYSFTGSKLQSIKGTAAKDRNYIAFPDVSINKESNYVVMEADMAADANILKLDNSKLLLKTAIASNSDEIRNHNSHASITMAHLRVGEVEYNRVNRAAIEVQMLLNTQNSKEINRIFGFTSPYKEVYSDYFYGAYLSNPDKHGLWGEINKSIVDPKNTKLKGGKGYFAGQNILAHSTNNSYSDKRYTLDPQWGVPSSLYDNRFRDTLIFNRIRLEESNNPIGEIVTNSDKYNIEEINTEDITIQLEKGWQYIGNPFTVPLDMTSFVEETTVPDDWKLVRTQEKGVKNHYYVMAGGTGSMDNWTPDRFSINPTWLVGQKVGSTLSTESEVNFILAPMQMIAVYANENTQITIPASKRTHRHPSKVLAQNELLLQVKSTSTDTPYGFDRTVVVFRSAATINTTKQYNRTKQLDSLSSAGQLFTISDQGKAMISNVVLESIETIELGLIPTLIPQDLTLDAFRLNTLTSVTELWLEDRISGDKQNLMENPTYTFKSIPEDRIDRFVLYVNHSGHLDPKPLPEGLFLSGGIPTSSFATKSTGPVGSIETDIKVAVNTEDVCSNAKAKINVQPSVNEIQYNVYDKYANGSLLVSAMGTGANLNILFDGAEDNLYYYLEAKSLDGSLTINRKRKLQFDFIKPLIYPDIRFTACPGEDIQLSSFLDTVNVTKVDWVKQSGSGILLNNQLQLPSNNKGLHVLNYTVSNQCNEKSRPSKLYIKPSNSMLYNVDTLVVCHISASTLQLNQIFGITGTIEAVTPGLDQYITIGGADKVFKDAFIFEGEKAFDNNILPDAPISYGVGSKQAIFKIKSDNNDCAYSSKNLVVIIN